eukprot:m.10151 g.10151  ORF g.10151 m.10151 type:complete len:77 (-) comp4207_c0_seq2:731-961(-)
MHTKNSCIFSNMMRGEPETCTRLLALTGRRPPTLSTAPKVCGIEDHQAGLRFSSPFSLPHHKLLALRYSRWKLSQH